ncbi:DUF839 domain-containing protein [Pseudomonas aeruginosa]|nr:DUF839 domain-containing protein [Pseudomonas aeruginosa]
MAGDEFERFDATASGQTGSGRLPQRTNTSAGSSEIDPFDPQSVPVKRTALGASPTKAWSAAPVKPGRQVVCYSGDDSQNEYICKARRPRQVPSGSQQRSPARRRAPSTSPASNGRWQASGCRWTSPTATPRGLSQGRGELRRPGRSADQHPAWPPMSSARPRWIARSGARSTRTTVTSTSPSPTTRRAPSPTRPTHG